MPLASLRQETDENIVLTGLSTTPNGGPQTLSFLETQVEDVVGAWGEVGTKPIEGKTASSESSVSEIGSFRGQGWEITKHEDVKTGADEVQIPTLEWVARQDPALTASVRKLVRTLWAIVVSRALQTRFPLQRTMVSVFEDPTERERTAVLRLICKSNAAQAVAFWDSLEPDIQRWLETLSDRDRLTFITKLSLRVHWKQ